MCCTFSKWLDLMAGPQDGGRICVVCSRNGWTTWLDHRTEGGFVLYVLEMADHRTEGGLCCTFSKWLDHMAGPQDGGRICVVRSRNGWTTWLDHRTEGGFVLYVLEMAGPHGWTTGRREDLCCTFSKWLDLMAGPQDGGRICVVRSRNGCSRPQAHPSVMEAVFQSNCTTSLIYHFMIIIQNCNFPDSQSYVLRIEHFVTF